MPLIGADILTGYIHGSRVVHIAGTYGSNKTSLAFRLAHDLVASGFCRYILSNVKSVWNTRPEDVELLDHGKRLTVDAVVILDEGGLFLKTGSDVEAFLAFLRKLNIVLLIPSYWPPPAKTKYLTVQRLLNLQILGIPLLRYGVKFQMGMIKADTSFWWHKPSEIFGIYDTTGMPSDDSGFSDWFLKWTNEASIRSGYGETKIHNSAVRFTGFTGEDSEKQPETLGLSALESVGRGADTFAEAAEALADSLSLLESIGDKNTRRKR